MIKKKHIPIAVVLLLPIIFLTLFLYHVHLGKKSLEALSPPPGITTFEEFAKVMGDPRVLSIEHKDGEPYIVWIGKTASRHALPSGPSCYVFRKNGKLSTWSPKTGDGEPGTDFMEMVLNKKSISKEEAIDFAKANTK